MDNKKLRGHIFHYPQQKQVHFYWLIALHTLDVFLNNISFGKGELHTAFIGSDLDIHKFFVVHILLNPNITENMFSGNLDDDNQQSLISVPSEDTLQPPKV